jgi:hypothetical protein
VLVFRAPVGGATADRGHRELGSVAGATAARMTFLLELAHVRPTLTAELTQRGAQGLVQNSKLLVVEGVAALRVETGAPEDLVGQQVAHAGQTLLVQEVRLERRRRGPGRRHPQGGGQLGLSYGQGIGTEPALVG